MPTHHQTPSEDMAHPTVAYLDETRRASHSLQTSKVKNFWEPIWTAYEVTVVGEREAIQRLSTAASNDYVRHPTKLNDTTSDFEAIAHGLRPIFAKYQQDRLTEPDLENSVGSAVYRDIIKDLCQKRGHNRLRTTSIMLFEGSRWDSRRPLTVLHAEALVAVAAEHLREKVGDSSLDIALGICFSSQQYGGAVRAYYLGPATGRSNPSDVAWLCNPSAKVDTADEATATADEWRLGHWAAMDVWRSSEHVRYNPPPPSRMSSTRFSTEVRLKRIAKVTYEGLNGKSKDETSVDEIEMLRSIADQPGVPMSNRFHKSPRLYQELDIISPTTNGYYQSVCCTGRRCCGCWTYRGRQPSQAKLDVTGKFSKSPSGGEQ